MNRMERPAPVGAGEWALDQTTGRADGNATAPRVQPPRKWQRVLQAFVDGGTFNRFDAYRELRDSCLNTTVSQIESRGVTILRAEETVPGAYGPVHCLRYRIAPDALQRAQVLLRGPALAEAASGALNALAGHKTLGSPTTQREEVVPTDTPESTPGATSSRELP